jgi:hypothetical protein
LRTTQTGTETLHVLVLILVFALAVVVLVKIVVLVLVLVVVFVFFNFVHVHVTAASLARTSTAELGRAPAGLALWPTGRTSQSRARSRGRRPVADDGGDGGVGERRRGFASSAAAAWQLVVRAQVTSVADAGRNGVSLEKGSRRAAWQTHLRLDWTENWRPQLGLSQR